MAAVDVGIADPAPVTSARGKATATIART